MANAPDPVVRRRAELERALEVLWIALDGNRKLQRGVTKDGEPVVFNEPAAGLVREVRAVTAELARLPVKSEVSKGDELRARREARRREADDPPPSSRRSQSRRRG